VFWPAVKERRPLNEGVRNREMGEKKKEDAKEQNLEGPKLFEPST
jgi:hypothetical protein